MRLNRTSYLDRLTRRGAQTALLLMFTGTITLSVGLNLFLAVTGITSLAASADAGTQSQTVLAEMGFAASIALYGIVTPLIEEFVFRGMFYSALYNYVIRKMIQETRNDGDTPCLRGHHTTIGVIPDRFPIRAFVIAAGISSILFGIYHMNLAQGIYGMMMGVSFCLAYELTGQFLSAWILHAACNMIALILSRSVNGTNVFTVLCTWPWTATFMAIAIVSYICLYRCLDSRK